MAKNRFLGQAPKIHQEDTITIALTWATNDTVNITIGGVTLVITIGSLVTTAQVATTVKEALNDETFTDTTASQSFAVADAGMFAELEATVSGSVVTVKTKDAFKGTPFTMSVTETTVGDGTATEATAITPSHPGDVSLGENWQTGARPAAFDDVEIRGDVELLYNLETFDTGAIDDFFAGDFNGRIGLKETNTDGAVAYSEYRPTHLKFANAPGKAIVVNDDVDSDRINIDIGALVNIIFDIRSSGTGEDPDEPAINLKGTGTGLQIRQQGGQVGWNVSRLDTGGTFTTIQVLGGSLEISDFTVTNLKVSAGAVTVKNVTGTNLEITNGGTVVMRNSGSFATLYDVVSGSLDYGSTTNVMTRLDIQSRGSVTFDNVPVALTITTLNTVPGASILAGNGLVTVTTWNINGGSLEEVTSDFGADRVYSVT